VPGSQWPKITPDAVADEDAASPRRADAAQRRAAVRAAAAGKGRS